MKIEVVLMVTTDTQERDKVPPSLDVFRVHADVDQALAWGTVSDRMARILAGAVRHGGKDVWLLTVDTVSRAALNWAAEKAGPLSFVDTCSLSEAEVELVCEWCRERELEFVRPVYPDFTQPDFTQPAIVPLTPSVVDELTIKGMGSFNSRIVGAFGTSSEQASIEKSKQTLAQVLEDDGDVLPICEGAWAASRRSTRKYHEVLEHWVRQVEKGNIHVVDGVVVYKGLP